MLEPSSTGSGKSKTQVAGLVGAVQCVIQIIAWGVGKPAPIELSVPITGLILYLQGACQRRALARMVEAPREPHQARPAPALAMPRSSEP